MSLLSEAHFLASESALAGLFGKIMIEKTLTVMNRSNFRHDGLTLSYLDSGGELPVTIALHAHWMEGATFSPLAEAIGSEWRLIALDQRGHGDSDHAQSYTREDYLGDLEALFRHLGLPHAVLLGNSLGGVNAYQFAASHPQWVRALVIEDMGVEVPGDLPPMLSWAGTFAKREELEKAIGSRLLPYLQDSFRPTTGGCWRLAFEPRDMLLSQASLAGNHWSDWLATDCPALVIRGTESRVTTAAHVAQMAERRAHTQLCTLEGGHVVHQDNPPAFAAAVRSFLGSCLGISRTRLQEQPSS
jgi:esterase